MERRWIAGLVGGLLVVGCTGASCPPDFPVARDGFCYRADGGERMPQGDGGMCDGTHPLVDGANRYCEPGDCYCAGMDSCFASAVAPACCGDTVVCGEVEAGMVDQDAGAPASDASAGCSGVHPLVEGARRYCEPGNCYCGDPDACFPAASAAACCNVGVVCE